MDNPLKNLKIDYWYKALLVAGVASLFLSLTVELKEIGNNIVQLISLGAIFIGLGEWINHPLQTRILPPGPHYSGWLKGQGYLRSNSFLGIAFDFVGVTLIGLGLYKLT